MIDFIEENILTIIFGLIASITSIISIKYIKKEHDVTVNKMIEVKDLASLYLTRDSMVKHMLIMLDEANAGDTIWGQCVGCSNYTDIVQEKSFDAVSRGAKFKVIVDKSAGAYEEFTRLLTSVKNTEVIGSDDNVLRIQGLSDREIIMGFRNVNSYVGVSIKNKYFVSILKNWFDNRFEEIRNHANE